MYEVKTLIKSLQNETRLNFFKNELLKVLDAKEKQENSLSKSIDDYFNSIDKSLLNEFGIEKGRVGTIGEIRTWKDGKKYKKMPDGKWVRVYQQHNRSAEISIARLKGRVRNAKSVDELMQIVMSNVHRFEDENGKILPIVEELKKEVAASKGKLNAGKPSTKEQIEKYQKEHAEKNPANNYSNQLDQIKKEYEKLKNVDFNTDDFESWNDLNDRMNSLMDKLKADVKDAWDKDKSYKGDLDNLYEDNMRFRFWVNNKFKDAQKKHEQKMATESINNNDVEIGKLSDEDKNEIKKIQGMIDNMIKTCGYYDYMIQDKCLEFARDENKNLNAAKMWMKLNGIKSFEEFKAYIKNGIINRIEADKKAKEQKKKEAHAKKLAKVRAATGDYKEPVSNKEYKKMEVENMPENFILNPVLRENVENVVNFMNENPSDNNDINYLFSNASQLDAAAGKRWNIKSDVNLVLVKNDGCYYSPDNREIYTKKTDTLDGIETYLHEFTHYMDNCLAEENSKYTHQGVHITQNNELLGSIKKMLIKSWDDVPEELRNYINEKENASGYREWNEKVTKDMKSRPTTTMSERVEYNRVAKEYNEEGNKRWKEHVKQMRSYGELEDMIAALSGGNLDKLTFGHNYFNSVAHRAGELLANYVSLSFTQKEQLKIFQRAFPSVAMELDNTINKMVQIFDERMQVKKSFSESMNLFLKEIKGYAG